MRRETAQSEHDVDKLLMLGEVYRTLLIALGYVADDVHDGEDDVCWTRSWAMTTILDPWSRLQCGKRLVSFVQERIH